MHCEKKQLIFWPFIHSNTTKLPAEQGLSGISDHALIVTNSAEHTLPGLGAGKALGKPGFFLAWLCFGLNSKWKKNPETTNQPKMSYWNQMPFLVLHILLFYWCSLKDPVSLTWNFQYEWIWNVTQDFMNHMCLISAFFSLFWFPVSAKI